MTVKDIQKALDATITTGGEYMDKEITSAFASDMMSEVLAFSKGQSVLITGLCNPQVIRTAEMLDISCIVLIRGKSANEEMISMAKDRDLIILETKYIMFSACGILYDLGLEGGTA
ncbi:MAG: hypothetical protein HFH60_11330 [Lachnospiraceae bacterium]|nr:hypothetical protein [Lachnospiraceae bacterium]